MNKPPGYVRPAFRIIGYVLGPLLILSGGSEIVLAVLKIATSGWRVWWSDDRGLTFTGVGTISLGILIAKAAWTGWDPYVTRDHDDIE